MNRTSIFAISMIIGVPLMLMFVFSTEPEIKTEQGIALAAVVAAVVSYVLALILATGEVAEEVDPEDKRVAEAERAFETLDRELLSIYNSLSHQYEKISDFLYLYPEYAVWLKETERYKDWRDRLLYWADENIERLKDFYFSDGLVCYIIQGLELVNVYDSNAMESDPGAAVLCEVALKKSRLPADYFQQAFTVWEEEDIDGDIRGRRRHSDSSATAFGIGIGAGIGLSGHDHHGDSHCGDGDCGCQ